MLSNHLSNHYGTKLHNPQYVFELVVLEDDKSIIYCLQEEFRLSTVFAVLTSTNLELQRN